MARVAGEIERRLKAALAPDHLEVIDESHLHRGHAGARPGGESHFRVVLVAEAFAGRSRIERQRLVYRALDELMQDEIHALAIVARTPDEAVEADRKA